MILQRVCLAAVFPPLEHQPLLRELGVVMDSGLAHQHQPFQVFLVA